MVRKMHGDGHAVDHGRHSVECFVPAIIAKNDSKHGNRIMDGGFCSAGPFFRQALRIILGGQSR